MKLKQINKEIEETRCETPEEVTLELNKSYQYTYIDYLFKFWHRYVWNYVSEIPLKIKTFIQRGIRGWANSDTWCFDFYLANVISGGIKHLLKYGNSCWTKKDLASLKEIIKTFETANEIEGHNLLYTPSKKFTWSDYKKQKRKCVYMNKKRKYPRDIKYRVMTLREVIKFEKGFDTFKEKFFHLWD